MREPSSSSSIVVIGIGDMETLCLPASIMERIAQADLLCGGERHLAIAQAAQAERVVIKSPLGDVLDRIQDAAQRDQRVVVLASGDPCCFGIGPLIGKRLGREHVEIIPNVGSVQLLFARLCEPWQDARILSAHGRPIEPVIGPAIASQRSAILTDDVNTPATLAHALLEAGMENCRAVVGERLGGPLEQLTDGRLEEFTDRSFDSLSILALFRDPSVVRTPMLGLPDNRYQHRGAMITKAEVRAISVSQLALERGDIVWDIGSGCGSVALETASFVDSGFVYAVESDPGQIEYLSKNLRAFPGPVRIVHGEAPGALFELPSPNAVFVGGSGGKIEAIVNAVIDRLKPSGRIVANFVVLDHLMACQKQIESAGFTTSVTQVGVSRLGHLRRLEALNSVFVLSARKATDGRLGQ